MNNLIVQEPYSAPFSFGAQLNQSKIS